MKKALVLLVASSYFLIPIPARADWLIDLSGTLVQVDGAILGDDDNVQEELEVETEEENNNGTGLEELKQQQEKSRELLKKQTEARLKVQERTGQRSKVEIETENGRYKLKQELKDANGRLLQKREIEIKDSESLHVEQAGGETVQIDLITDGRLEMVKHRIKTSTDLDLQVGEKNEISVTLPSGEVKEIALPDQALEKLIERGVIAAKEGEDDAYELTAGDNGEPVYKVQGTVKKRLFWLFNFNVAHDMEVAAADSQDGSTVSGDVVKSESQETGWRRFWERLAI